MQRMLIAAVAMLLAVVILYAYVDQRREGQADLGGKGIIVEAPVGGTFTLVDHTGQTVTDETFRGKYVLLFFGFTNCPDVCPLTLDRFVQVLEMLGSDAANIQPILVTIDPERDTPTVLADYVRSFDPRFLGLTGTPEQIAAMTKAYKVYAQKGKPDEDGTYTVNHSGFEYLMGPDGRNVYVFTSKTTPEQMAEAIRIRLDQG